jgi:hypothetical protein
MIGETGERGFTSGRSVLTGHSSLPPANHGFRRAPNFSCQVVQIRSADTATHCAMRLFAECNDRRNANRVDVASYIYPLT